MGSSYLTFIPFVPQEVTAVSTNLALKSTYPEDKTADVIPSGTPCRMAVMTWCLAIEKTCPTNIYAAFSPRSGGAVTMVSCYWQGSYPEPTQWGCGGGQVEALLSGGGLRSGEAEANILCEGLGGETTARVTTIYRHPCPSPLWLCGRKMKGSRAKQWGNADKNYEPYFTVVTARPCEVEDDDPLHQAAD